MPNLKVLMFGWEFPPYNVGGLGVACKELVKALSKQGVSIVFVLPKKMNLKTDFCRFVFASETTIENIDLLMLMSAYSTARHFQNLMEFEKEPGLYFFDLINEVKRYAMMAKKIAVSQKYDLIHAHDWLSFPAGIEAKRISGKPLIAHIHATEFDRTGGQGINNEVYEIEKKGLEKADLIIAVSNFTKDKIVKHYGINPHKIKVIHNAVDIDNDFSPVLSELENSTLKQKVKIVLFVGRLTLQKGADYFLEAAKKTLEYEPNVLFVIIGSGDMEKQLIEKSLELNIADKVIFTGFLRGDELKKIYRLADLYVLPSVSEPFGITPLEALKHGTPVLISKQSGVSEVLHHCLKVDFWDINQMTDKILAVLRYKELQESLKENGGEEIKNLTWQNSAKNCIQVYEEALK